MTRALAALLLGLLVPAVAKAADLSLRILDESKPQVVFSAARQGCDRADLPDAPLRALRLPDGTVVAFASHYRTRAETGPDLRTLRHDCKVRLSSAENQDPSAFDDRTWVSALWSRDGQNVVALGHQEFQAQRFPGRCPAATYGACWYNSVNLLVSRDGGASFARARREPVAALNLRSEDRQGSPRGFFEPSNLVELDGFVWSMINTTGGQPEQSPGVCLFRTPVDNPEGGWEYLAGSGDWSPAFHNPYVDPPAEPCRTLKGIFGPVHSVVRHRPSGRFVALMTIPGGPNKGAFALSTSADLLTWSKPRPFTTLPSRQSGACGTAVHSYPSLVDPQALGRTFDDVGDTALLFFIREALKGCAGSLDRDLIRFEVEFTEQ